MAYWLKAAEDLFEVVDRRAKLAVGDQPDEPPNTVSPASNGQGVQAKRTRSKAKIQKPLAVKETTATLDTAQEATSSETQADVAADKEKVTSSIENTTTRNEEQQSDKIDGDGTSTATPSLTISSNDDVKPESPDHGGADTAAPVITEVDADVIADTPSEVREEVLNSPIREKGIEVVMDVVIPDSVSSVDVNMEESSSFDPLVENQPDQKKNLEQKDVDSPKKVQEQLDEAQGLLKSAISTGPSKEARLARVCAGLSSRLQEYKSENGQLEELLMAERELSKSYETHIQQLQRDLSASKSEIDRVESHMVEALAAKNSEIETLVSSADALKKQAAIAEGSLASLQANMESLMRSRELAETRMMQALREELASVERRAEEERAAHNASKKAAMEREVELERHALDASTALARTQRTADERTAKAVELEQKIALLEVECASLNQELQDMEARARREHKKSPEESNQVIQMQAWQEEVERARQGQRDAESTLSSLEAELQKMRIEMAAMKRDAEHYSRQEHTELEKRYRELTDLLYYKQTQLEAMASEKAAAEFQLEKETKRIREVQIEVEKSRATRRGSASWEEDTDMKALEPLPLHHRHLAVAGVQLQKAAKLLDSAAVRATRFLWRYPVARVLLLFYMVFVHFFLMYLLHRLQEQADTFANLELAQSMGHGNHTFT